MMDLNSLEKYTESAKKNSVFLLKTVNTKYSCSLIVQSYTVKISVFNSEDS